MKNSELGDLSVRCAWRNAEPVVVVRQFLEMTQIELGWVTQTRKSVSVAVGWSDQEFAGAQAVSLLRSSIGNFDMRFALQFADREHQRRPRLEGRFRQFFLGKATVNDVTGLGWRKEFQFGLP